MAGAHDHTHGMIGSKLRTAFLLTIVILFVEVAGGLVSHSLALLSDAGHVATDLVALGLAWYATTQSGRPADVRNTYGYHRTGILIALVNAASLIAVVVVIGIEAVQRFQNPQPVTPLFMFVAAAVGIVVNLYIGLGLRSAEEANLNVRAAMLHVFGDVGASAAVIVAGAIIVLTGWAPIDPLLSLAIAALIAKGAWDILGETIDVLMEAVPKNLNVAQLVRDVMRLPDVEDVHDLHVWSLAGGMTLLSAHVQVRNDCILSRGETIVAEIDHLLQQRYAISHATIQLEHARCAESALHCCFGTMAEEVPGHDHSGHDHAGHEPNGHNHGQSRGLSGPPGVPIRSNVAIESGADDG